MISWRTLILVLALAAVPARADVNAADLVRDGKSDEALRALNAQIETHPNDAQAYNLLCRVYFQLELWDTSLRMAEKSVSLDPQNSGYHEWLGRAAGRKAENSNPFTAFALARRVRAEFERAVALDGDNIPARMDLAEYYMEAPSFLGGDKNKARQQADAVSHHDAALAIYIYAKIEEKQGNPQAEQEFKRAITASDHAARFWIELAYFYRRTGRIQEMESAVNQAEASPHREGVSDYDASYLLLRSGRNFGGAIAMLRRYISGDDLSEDAPLFHAHYMLAQVLEKQGNRQAAANEYRAALSLASQYRPARDALARLSR